VVEAAARDGGAIAAVPVTETLKLASSDLLVERTLSRESLYRAQTPQCFRYDLLARAARQAVADSFSGTDEASLVERLSVPIRIVPGSEQNLKVTTADDLERLRFYLEKGEC
jgi:2-C-methyl-D-erythritol 4-phosphate cytidylyltransferase